MPEEYVDGDYRVIEHENGAVERMLIAPSPPEPEPVVIVTPAKALIVLEQAGLLDDLEAWIATRPRAEQIAFERVQEFRSDSPLLLAGAAALGLSNAQLMELFVEARDVVI